MGYGNTLRPFPILASSMVSPRDHLGAVISLLLFGSLFLSTLILWPPPHEAQAPLDVAFANQFDGLQRLVLSLLRSAPHVQNLRVASAALEDLSYALTAVSAGPPSDDAQRQIYALSQEVDAIAGLMQGLYVEVDALVHL